MIDKEFHSCLYGNFILVLNIFLKDTMLDLKLQKMEYKSVYLINLQNCLFVCNRNFEKFNKMPEISMRKNAEIRKNMSIITS